MLRRALALVLSLLVSSPAWAATPGETLQRVFADANRILADPVTEERPLERFAAIEQLVGDTFDFRGAAELASGRRWQSLAPAEREEFTRLFAGLLARSYLLRLTSKISLDGGVKVQYLGDSAEEGSSIVRTAVVRRDGGESLVDYRMIQRGDRWLVRDVIIDGLSVVANYRAQLDRVLATSTMADVLRQMRAKVAAQDPVSALALSDAPPMIVTQAPPLVVAKAPPVIVTNASPVIPAKASPVIAANASPVIVTKAPDPVPAKAPEPVAANASGPIREKTPEPPAARVSDVIEVTPIDRAESNAPAAIAVKAPEPPRPRMAGAVQTKAPEVIQPKPPAAAPAKIPDTVEVKKPAATVAKAPEPVKAKVDALPVIPAMSIEPTPLPRMVMTTPVLTTRAYWLEVGPLRSVEEAGRLAARTRGSRIVPASGTAKGQLRVHLGPFTDAAAAVSELLELQTKGYDPFLVAERN